MNSEDLKIVMDFLEQERLAIIASQTEKGLKAHGTSAEQLRVNMTENTGQLIDGTGSFEYQERGREAGKAPPFKRIYDWLELRKYGLDWTRVTTGEALRGVTADMKRRYMAWAIVMKIKRLGTYTAIRKVHTGVVTDNLTQQKIADLLNLFRAKYVTQFSSDFIHLIK